MLETDDNEYHDFVLRELQATVGERIHEQVWVLLATEEVPERAFPEFYVKSLNPSQSQAEIKSLPMVDRIHKVYQSMLTIGQELQRVLKDPNKKTTAVDSVLSTQSLALLPAQEDIQSAITAEQQTLREYLDFIEPCDILLEDEMCWPVKPDLDY